MYGGIGSIIFIINTSLTAKVNFHMTSVIELYENLAAATDDKTRARIIAEAFEALEERYPNLSDVATKTCLSETELRLQKEIKETELRLQKEIKETELRLAKEIEETELRLAKEIEETRGEIKATELRLQKEIGQIRVDLTQAIHRQTLWVVGSVGAIIGLLRLLDLVTA